MSVNQSSRLDVFTLLSCRDCAKCEQTQQIKQPGAGGGGRAVNCGVVGCEVTARPANELDQGTKRDVHKHGFV